MGKVDWSQFTPVDDGDTGVDWSQFTPIEETPSKGILGRIFSEEAPKRDPLDAMAGMASEPGTPAPTIHPTKRSVLDNLPHPTPPLDTSEKEAKIDLGAGPVRQDFVDKTKSVLKQLPVSDQDKLSKTDTRIGKIAKDLLPETQDRLARTQSGDLLPRTQEDVIAGVMTPRTVSYEDKAAANKQWLEENKPGVIAAIKKQYRLDDPDAEVEYNRMVEKRVKPAGIESAMPVATAIKSLEAGIDSMPASFKKSIIGISQALREGSTYEIPRQEVLSLNAEFDKQVRQARGAAGGKIEPGSWNDVIASAPASLALNLPPLLAAGWLYSRGNIPAAMAVANAGLGIMGAQKFGERYLQGQVKGLSQADNLAQATLSAAAEVIPEKFSFNALFKVFGKMAEGTVSKIAKEFVLQQGIEHTTEQITTISDYLIDRAYLEPNKPIADLMADMKQTAMATLLQGPVLAGGGMLTHTAGTGYGQAKQAWENSRDLTAGMEFNQSAIDQQVRSALNPDRAGMELVGRPAPMEAPKQRAGYVPPASTPEETASKVMGAADPNASMEQQVATTIAATEAVTSEMSPGDAALLARLEAVQKPPIQSQEIANGLTPDQAIESKPETPAEAATTVLANGTPQEIPLGDNVSGGRIAGELAPKSPAPVPGDAVAAKDRDAVAQSKFKDIDSADEATRHDMLQFVAERATSDSDLSAILDRLPDPLQSEPFTGNTSRIAFGVLNNKAAGEQTKKRAKKIYSGATRGTDTPIIGGSSADQPVGTTPNTESRNANPVAESQALPPSERSDAGVAPRQDGVAPDTPAPNKTSEAPRGTFTKREGGGYNVTGYSQAEMRAALDKVGIKTLGVGKSGNVALPKSANLNALKEALNPGTAYLPSKEEVAKMADQLPEFKESSKPFNLRKAYNHTQKHGVKRFHGEADAKAYADALKLGEGGNWEPKRVRASGGVMGYWHVERVADNKPVGEPTTAQGSDSLSSVNEKEVLIRANYDAKKAFDHEPRVSVAKVRATEAAYDVLLEDANITIEGMAARANGESIADVKKRGQEFANKEKSYALEDYVLALFKDEKKAESALQLLESVYQEAEKIGESQTRIPAKNASAESVNTSQEAQGTVTKSVQSDTTPVPDSEKRPPAPVADASAAEHIPESKTIAEASLGDLLRAAADKADGKVVSEGGKPVATKEQSTAVDVINGIPIIGAIGLVSSDTIRQKLIGMVGEYGENITTEGGRIDRIGLRGLSNLEIGKKKLRKSFHSPDGNPEHKLPGTSVISIGGDIGLDGVEQSLSDDELQSSLLLVGRYGDSDLVAVVVGRSVSDPDYEGDQGESVLTGAKVIAYLRKTPKDVAEAKPVAEKPAEDQFVKGTGADIADVRLNEARRLLGQYTRGNFDIWQLAGPSMAKARSQVMSALMGVERYPQAKSGVTAIRAEFYQQLGITGETPNDRENEFLRWAKPAEGGTLESRSPTFYSQLSRAIDQAPEKIFTSAGQVKLWLIGNASKLGIKQDEIQWTGITDYLTLMGKQKVSKEDVLAYLKGNGVQVREVTLGQGKETVSSKIDEQFEDELANAANDSTSDYWYEIIKDQVQKEGLDWGELGRRESEALLERAMPFDERVEEMRREFGADMRRTIADQVEEEASYEGSDYDDTKFSTYTPPGGKPGSYRELLLTLPKREGALTKLPDGTRVMQLQDGDWWVSNEDGTDLTKGSFPSKEEAVSAALKNINAGRFRAYKDDGANFQSSHYPDHKNILAHLRVDEVSGANGERLLRVVEIQSDHAQKGRKEGFKNAAQAQKRASLEKEQQEINDKLGAANGELYEYRVDKSDARSSTNNLRLDNPEVKAKAEARDELVERSFWLQRELSDLNYKERGAVPAAPFVQDTGAWVALAVKKAINFAAENGMDGIVFATGRQNADFYDLSKQVDTIGYQKRGDNFNVTVWSKEGARVWINQSATAKEVEDTIGKEMLDRMTKEQGRAEGGLHYLEGVDLKVGGEGQLKFYGTPQTFDRDMASKQPPIVPVTVNTVLRQIKADTKASLFDLAEIPESEKDNGKAKWEKTLIGFKITDSIRNIAMQGMPLFSKLDLQGREFWRKIKAGESFTEKEIQDAYSLGRRGTKRTASELATGKTVVEAEAARQDFGWNETLAGFQGYRTVGVDAGNGVFLMGIIPEKLYRGNTLRDIEDTQLIGYRFTPEAGKYRLDVLDPKEGSTAFIEADSRGAFAPTGESDFNNSPYYRVKLDNRYSTSRALLQEAVRRLALNIGQVPTIIQSGRDTGARAYDDTVREYSADTIEQKFSAAPETRITNETPETIRTALSKAFGKSAIASLERKGLLKIHADASTLPSDISLSSKGVAVWDGETAHLIANRMNAATAKRELLHEIGTHYNLDQMLGKKGFDALTSRIRKMHEYGDKTVLEAYRFVHEVYPEYSEDSWQFMQETLAHIGQDANIQSKPWWKEIIATVRRWLVQLGYGGFIKDSDIQDMVLHSLKMAAREDRVANAGKVMGDYALEQKAGQPAYKAVDVESPEFKKWSGGAPIKSEGFKTGEAVVVKAYHGTAADIVEFDTSKTQLVDGIFTTPSADYASLFARGRQGNGNVMPLYVRFENPRVIDVSKGDYYNNYSLESAFTSNDNDGIIVIDDDGKFHVAIAKTNTQIKSSISNTGAFGDTGNILEARNSITGKNNFPMPPSETKTEAAQRTFQDAFNRFRVVQDWMKGRGITINDKNNVYNAEIRMHGRFANKAQDFREGTLEPLIKEVQKAGFTKAQIDTYLHAQHAEERNIQIAKINPKMPDGGSGMKTATARAILAAADPKLKALANKFQKITAGTKQILRDSGILTPEMVAAWDKAYSQYVPLKGGEETGTQQGAGKGYSVNGKQKRALGHGERLEYIVENIARDRERALLLAEHNEVGKHLLALALDLGNDDIISIGKPEKRGVLMPGKSSFDVQYHGSSIATFTNKQDALTFIRTDGRAGYAIVESKGDPAVQYMATGQLGANEALVYVGGHAIRVQINDDILAREYKKLGVERVTMIFEIGREVNTWLSKAYTGYNPEFILRNIRRDLTTGLVNVTADYGGTVAGRAAKLYLGSLMEATYYSMTGKASPMVDLYRKHGGNVGAAYLSDIERIGQDIKHNFDRATGVIGVAKEGRYGAASRVAFEKTIGWMMGWIEHLNAGGENGMRLAVFKALIGSGKSPEEAAVAAKGMTLNFNKKGEIGSQMGAMWLFYNPAVQDAARLTKTLLKSDHKAQAWAIVGSLAMFQFLSGLLQYGDDDDGEYRRIPQQIRMKNFIIRTGPGTYLTWDVPFGFGWFFGIGNAAYEAYLGVDKQKIGIHLAAGFLDNFSPIGNPVEDNGEILPANIAPFTPFKALAQFWDNKTNFGNPIMPDNKYAPNTPDHLRMWKGTKGGAYDQATQWLNDMTGGTKTRPGAIDVSPETLKWMMNTIGGGTAIFMGDTLSLAVLGGRAALTEDRENVPGLAPEIREIPIVRGVVKKESIQWYRTQFYEAQKEALKAKEAFNLAWKEGDTEAFDKVGPREKGLQELAMAVSFFQESIKWSRDREVAIQTDKERSEGWKRNQLDIVEKEEMKLYKDFFAISEEIRKR